jgi:hypothetical protein
VSWLFWLEQLGRPCFASPVSSLAGLSCHVFMVVKETPKESKSQAIQKSLLVSFDGIQWTTVSQMSESMGRMRGGFRVIWQRLKNWDHFFFYHLSQPKI